jgi:N-acetylmuramoyl-L-alanine amidase
MSGKIIRLVGALLALVWMSVAAGTTGIVHKVRLAAGPDVTRVVLDLSQPLSHTVFTLNDPLRVVVDLHSANIDSARAHLPPGTGVVSRVRVANRDNGDARVVLDLSGPARLRTYPVPPDGPNGHRLVIDLDAPQSGQGVVTRASEARGRDVVVAIDAGHGGKDPGATGRKGTREKDVVLNIARKLKARLDAEPGITGYLTRDGDYFLTLRQRIDRARARRADLFVSIHADAFRNRKARGSSVYVLSPRGATDEAARWLAERENSADLVGGVRLDDKEPLLASVLLDLSQSAAIDASTEVAERVLGQLSAVGRLHRSEVQKAGFVVLKSPDIPSLLVETAFISNPAEEQQLRNERHQDLLATALANGVRSYFYANPPPGTTLAMEGPPARRGPSEHIIVRGDTLSEIAQRYNVSLRALRSLNGLRNDRIRIGQVLRIPPSGG